MRIAKEVSFRQIDDEFFLLNRPASLIHAFNDLGNMIWKGIVEGSSSEQILDQITTLYEVDRETATRDFDEFIAELESKGLISRR